MNFWLVQTEGEFNQVLIEAATAQEAMERVEFISDSIQNAENAPEPVAIKDSPLEWPVPIFANSCFQDSLEAQAFFANKMGALIADDLAAKGNGN